MEKKNPTETNEKGRNLQQKVSLSCHHVALKLPPVLYELNKCNSRPNENKERD